MLTHSPYDAEAAAPSERDTPPLPFEAEFDGVRRQFAAPEQPMLDPSRYWDMHGGTD
jgi:hypothetical protein